QFNFRNYRTYRFLALLNFSLWLRLWPPDLTLVFTFIVLLPLFSLINFVLYLLTRKLKRKTGTQVKIFIGISFVLPTLRIHPSPSHSSHAEAISWPVSSRALQCRVKLLVPQPSPPRSIRQRSATPLPGS